MLIDKTVNIFHSRYFLFYSILYVSWTIAELEKTCLKTIQIYLMYSEHHINGLKSWNVPVINLWWTSHQYIKHIWISRFILKSSVYHSNWNVVFQITPNGFANLAAGCTMLQTVILNDIFTLDDLCIEVRTQNSPY